MPASRNATGRKLLAARKGRGNGRDASQKAAALLRRRKAIEMKAAGATYEQIGEALGVSNKTAYYDVQEAASELAEETQLVATNWKAIELRTLDLTQRNMIPMVQGTKGTEGPTRVAAANAVVRISERRAKLLGLDAPLRAQVATAVVGGSAVVEDQAALLTSDQLLARLETVRRGLLGAPRGDDPAGGAPTAAQEPEDALQAAYARVVAQRNGGNGGNGNG